MTFINGCLERAGAERAPDTRGHSSGPETPLTSATVAAAAWGFSDPRLPERIGHYHIKRRIGEGGMGRVYLAVQEKPRRTVALKLMRPGIASRSALRRFEYESQILARLRHPNIAHVYEAGTHDDGEGGLPYFAMEYVPNPKTLTQYARQRDLGIRERLELFAKVCDAVSHGHQKGIIHRDLKPQNILVDANGEPKIIDFGVARATDSDLAVTTLQTDVGQLIGTLQYMSPEQCEADPDAIDARSDVYALGVVLFELLCGSLPYDVGRAAIHEATRIVREDRPVRPSAVNKTLRGDVETITLKALDKEPHRRYQSSAALLEDVRRYLQDEPILARRPSLSYQFQVFLRRNPVLSGAIAFGLMVLVLTSLNGLVALTIALALGLFATSVATMLLVRAKREATRQRDDAERARTEAESERNNARAAERAAEVGREVAETARHEAEISVERSRRTQAFLQGMLGSVNFYETQEYDKAVLRRLYDHAAGQAETELADQPEVAASVRLTIGLGYLAISLFEEAEHHLEWALEQRRAHRQAAPLDYAECTEAMANLRHHQSRPQDTEAIAREGLAIYRDETGLEDPRALKLLEWLGWSLFEQGRPAEAEDAWREVMATRRRQLGAEHPLVAGTMYVLVDALIAQERFEEGETLCRRALDLSRTLHGPKSREVGNITDSLGWIILGQGRPGEAETLFREALEINDETMGEDYPASIFPARGLAKSLVEQGHYDDAGELYRWMLTTLEPKLGSRHRWIASAEREYGRLLTLVGRYKEAENRLLHGRETWLIVHGGQEEDRWAMEFIELLLDLYERWGRREQAAQWRAKLAAA